MISQQEMLDMVATEAAEMHQPDFGLEPAPRPDEPTVYMTLRLVQHPDGRLEWKD